MLKFIDPDHPFYRPLWVRLLIVAFCAGWTVVEFLGEQAMWGMIFLAMTAYASAALLVFYKPSEKGEEKAADAEGKDGGDGAAS